ncbi:hypothetical protein CXG81DRAFT_24780 [Caulochytrium protostelioides]|uniref:Uncharacterized protein n=1 Tax=Caulochytrium protostelioides TaxID=1555241 RepID=A0A4P9XB01_9FUNG|nr:hypothetical protein CXG81DRAFT_24780 [Caulochytrium protostelioides]|eukprot:RKP02567.1 hypothetical protein CXG81DRAFT_24780 [Caulochytrium protostelioides]
MADAQALGGDDTLALGHLAELIQLLETSRNALTQLLQTVHQTPPDVPLEVSASDGVLGRDGESDGGDGDDGDNDGDNDGDDDGDGGDPGDARPRKRRARVTLGLEDRKAWIAVAMHDTMDRLTAFGRKNQLGSLWRYPREAYAETTADAIGDAAADDIADGHVDTSTAAPPLPPGLKRVREAATRLAARPMQLPLRREQIAEQMAQLIARTQAKINASNVNEFVDARAPLFRRGADGRVVRVPHGGGDGLGRTGPADAGITSRVHPAQIDRHLQMQLSVVVNAGGPLARSTQRLDPTHDGPGPGAAQPLPTYFPSGLPAHALQERMAAVQQHLNLHFAPQAMPRDLYERVKALEDRLVELEQVYPEWAAFHFVQPNVPATYHPSSYIQRTRPTDPASERVRHALVQRQARARRDAYMQDIDRRVDALLAASTTAHKPQKPRP